MELSSKKNQNKDEYNFTSKYKESQESLLLEVCLTLENRFDKVRQKLSDYKLTCKALEDYIKLFKIIV